jgi:hypothetical protein
MVACDVFDCWSNGLCVPWLDAYRSNNIL